MPSKPRTRPSQPSEAAYLRSEDAVARMYAPEMYPCGWCGLAVASGYVCTYCGSLDPRNGVPPSRIGRVSKGCPGSRS